MQNPSLEHLWIDTDLAIGYERPEGGGYADVDDGFAIAQLLNSIPKRVKGISTVFGNTTLENAYHLTRAFLEFYPQLEVPAFKGANGMLQSGNPEQTDAVDALARALQNHKMTILAIGPLSNIATLLFLHPAAAENIAEIVMVAGRQSENDHFFVGDNALPFPDFNFELDPVAFQIVAQSSIPITLCPFEISSKVWIRDEDLDQLSRGNDISGFIAGKSRPWLANWKEFGSTGFNPFDAIASHYLLYPQDVQMKKLKARVEYHPDDTVREKSYKPYLICDNKWGRAVNYCYQPTDEEVLKRKLLNDLNKSATYDHT